jgi:hypothetical protein
MKKTLIFIGIVFAALVVAWGYSDGAKSNELVLSQEEEEAVPVNESLFFNPDSLSYYAALAYKDDDPKGLFVTGAAAYLKWQGDLPRDYATASRDEADIMLLHAADLGNEDAKNLILCLHKNGFWHHSLPE